MAVTYTKIHRFGTQAQYDALATKNDNLLYFTSDTKKLYKGSLDYTDQFITTATVGATGVAGKEYFETSTGQVKAYVDGAWKVIAYPIDTDFVDEAGDDVHVPTTKAVVDFVTDAISDIEPGNMVKSIAQKVDGSDNPVVGTFTYTKGDNSTVDVQLSGVAGTPTWDTTTRELVIPVVGGNAVTCSIGKDIFIDPAAPNGYNPTDNTIDIYLNDGATTAEDTKIAIPVDQLVEDYIGADTATIDLDVDANHVVTANVKLSATAGNALSTQADGLYISLEAYMTTAAADARFDAVEDRATAVEGRLDVLEGDANTSGSVAYSIKNMTTADSTIINNFESRLQDLEAAITAATAWGTFSE